jgi:TonB-dependent starch-binding outer membrane protein SusC
LNAGIDYTTSEGHNDAPTNAAWIFENGGGQRIDYTGENKSKLLDLYANYLKEVGKSRFDVTAGYSYQSFERDGTNFGRNAQMGEAIIYTDYQTSVVNGDSVEVPRKFVSNPNYLVSFFGRLNYSFNDKYLLTVSFRDDASSRFSEDNRWKIFPAAAVGWNINKEPFMESAKAVSNLKLRASYGVTGNQDVTNIPYPYLSTYQLSSSTSQYQFGNTFYNTFRPQPYDANIRWETTTQIDVGVDFGLFGDRITGTVDFYKKDTEDLINSIPVPGGSNFSNFLLTNVGNLVNKGVEITINTVPIKTEKFEWNFGFNFTYNENEVTKLLKTEDPNYPGVQVGGIGLQRYIQNIQVGYPVNTFLVFKQVYNDQGAPVEGLYVDKTGLGGDVTANENNKFRYQKPQADYLIGINSRVNYGNWDFYFSGRASIGNYVYNNVHTGANYSNFYYTTGYFNNLPGAVNDSKFQNLQSFSDYYLENASFFKMDNISLGYNVKQLFSEKLKARFSFTVQNAFFITDYKGLDPEVNNVNTAANTASSGIDNNIYPRARIFMLGVNLSY